MRTPSQFYQRLKGKYIDSVGKIGSKLSWVANYMGQCASLVRQFLVQCYGYPDRPYGDGGDFGSIPKGKRIKTPKDWCIIVYPKQPGLPYGHVAIYYKGKMISQNPNKVAIIPLWKGKKFYVQPHVFKKPVAPKPPTKPKIKIPTGAKKMKKAHTYKVVASAGLNVRRAPKIANNIFRRLPQGATFRSDYYLDLNGYRWLLYITGGVVYYASEASLADVKRNSKGKTKGKKLGYFVKDITK